MKFLNWFRRPPYSVEPFQDSDKAWRWRIRAANGEILATSEAYSSRQAAFNTAQNLVDWTGIPWLP